MKVLHLSGSHAGGGAGRGAQWLHEGLLGLGVDSRICFRKQQLHDLARQSVRGAARAFAERARISLNLRVSEALHPAGSVRSFFATPFTASLPEDRGAFAAADVIHAHWIADGSFDFAKLSAARRPVVVTLRDMWPFTGGCSYDLGCGRFTGICAPCPAVKRPFASRLARHAQERRRLACKPPICFVAISSWLRDRARDSTVLAGCDVRAIPNAIDTDTFFPVETPPLRRRLGIADDDRVVLAGCLDLDSGYKNMQALPPIWEKVGRKGRRLIVFGNGGQALRAQLPDDAIFTGSIGASAQLRELYSLADVFLSPSLQEAFGKTAAEAAACGAPVVAFSDTGTADIIRHGETGYLAVHGRVEELIRHIDLVLEQGGRSSELGRCGRELCLANFSQPAVARQYLELYRELLGMSRLDGEEVG